MNTDPAQFQRLLDKIPDELMPNVWFIPLGKETKDPDIPKGEKLKNQKYRLTQEEAIERIRSGKNVGIYAMAGGILFLDADVSQGKIVLPMEMLATIPTTLTVRTRNGGRHYYFMNSGDFKNKNHTYEGKKAGELRADWNYVVAPGSYVATDKDVALDGDGLYTILIDASIAKFEKIPAGITIKIEDDKKDIVLEPTHTWKNDIGMPLFDIRRKDEKLDKLLKWAGDCGYPSRSEADMATAQKLYFWRFSAPDITGILRKYRPYEKTARDDYLNTTISNIQQCARYDPNYKVNNEHQAVYSEMDLKDIKALQQKESDRHLKINLPEDHFISEYVKWLSSLSDGYEDYQIVAALWILSALTKGRAVFRLKQEAIKPNLWIMIIGKSTTSRKSTIVNKTRQMFEVATDSNLPNQDYSLEGYLETLSSKPILNNVRDEAAGLLAKFQKKYNEGILELECQIYDGQDTEKT